MQKIIQNVKHENFASKFQYHSSFNFHAISKCKQIFFIIFLYMVNIENEWKHSVISILLSSFIFLVEVTGIICMFKLQHSYNVFSTRLYPTLFLHLSTLSNVDVWATSITLPRDIAMFLLWAMFPDIAMFLLWAMYTCPQAPI